MNMLLPPNRDNKNTGLDADFGQWPVISIITVVLNNKTQLEKTIESVASQTYKNIEYIVIDGGSTDGTLGLIRNHKDLINVWISETDSGIYEAMNKGIALAKGEFINFLNAGDLFYENITLEKIFREYRHDADLIYGDCEMIYGCSSRRVKKANDVSGLWKGMTFSHQSLFVRSPLLKANGFNTTLGIAADFDLIFSMYLKGHKFYYTNTVVSSVLAGGVSDKHCLQAVKGWRQVVRKHENSVKVRLHYGFLTFNLFLISMMKKIFPRRIINSIHRFNKEIRCFIRG